MLIRSIKMQMSEMLRKRIVIFTYLVVLVFMSVNFLNNMINNKEVEYVTQMYDPIKLFTLSDWSVIGHFFMEYFPLLVVLPTACAWLTDRDTRVKVYIQSRVGNTCYWYGKMICVFFTTFLIFTVPFFIEIILSCLCFSLKSAGDPSNFSYLQTIEGESRYFLSQIWLNHRILYAIIMILFFGIVSGILSVFNFSITTIPVFKYKIFTFFPIYILFYLISLAAAITGVGYTVYYAFILRVFNISPKNWMVYGLFLLCLACVSVFMINFKTKRDDIL